MGSHQPSTATANARWPFLAKLLEEIDRLRIVAVFSCPSEQTLHFSPIAYVTTIQKRDRPILTLRERAAYVFGGTSGAVLAVWMS